MTFFRARQALVAADSPPRAAGRLEFLDALRGLAAFAVILQHAGQNLSPSYSAFAFSIFDLGNFGVTVFFLCSGFIIPISLERQGSLRSFWIRRFFRLYPLYWFCIVADLLLGYLSGWARYPAGFFSHPAAYILANLTMFQNSIGFSDILGPAWTLPFELMFYIIVSIQFRMGLIKYTVPMAVGILLSAVIVEGIVPLTLGILLPNGIVSFYGTMFVGAVFYRYSTGEIGRSTLQGVLVLAIVTELVTLLGDLYLQPVWFHWITARLLAYVVFILALTFRKQFSARWLCGLGVISYSLYLVHPYPMALIGNQQNVWLTLCVWVVAIVLVASVTYRLVERPAIALGRRLTSSPAASPMPDTRDPALSQASAAGYPVSIASEKSTAK
jgi:peptidoglycan/LPS O-acetylase OafA/YrhL